MRAIPPDNLAFPTLIILNNGISGSGFRIRTETENYLVTAKHVIFDQHGKLNSDLATIHSQSRDIDDDSKEVLEIDLKKLESSRIFHHPTADVATLHLGKIINYRDDSFYEFKYFEGIVQIEKPLSSVVIWNATKRVRFIEDVLISNDVFIGGYPSSLGLQESPQFDYNRPLLRKGIIADVNKKLGTIILDCPVYYGNSGGPVIQVTELRIGYFEYDVIGVVSQFIPYSESWINQSNNIEHTEWSNSGYSVAVAMNSIFEMLGILKPKRVINS